MRFIHPQNLIPKLRPLIKAYMWIVAKLIPSDRNRVLCGALTG